VEPQEFLPTVPTAPGVYVMYDAERKVLYVGKAKNLRNRLRSYFKTSTDAKVNQLVKRIAFIETTITENERAALVLEINLIKSLKPRYNVVFRDDKSYPYIFISDDKYPRLVTHRGAKQLSGDYFGPFTGARYVRQTLAMLQKTFQLRQCDNSFFRSRTRPCLQYQIKRCSAPCVAKINQSEYLNQVTSAKMILNGDGDDLIADLQSQMDEYAAVLNYEAAAKLRDKISMLRALQDKNVVLDANEKHDLDIVAVAANGTNACIQQLYIRAGKIQGVKQHVIKDNYFASKVELVENFIYYNYQDGTDTVKPCRLEIIVNVTLQLDQEQGSTELPCIKLHKPSRGIKLKWLQMAELNAEKALSRLATSQGSFEDKITQLEVLLDKQIDTIACFDVSHISGTNTVAVCVSCDKSGWKKDNYRKFNIKAAKKSDDYGAMHEALTRYLERLQTEGGQIPCILIVDGGRGQLKILEQLLLDLQIPDCMPLAIAKGLKRKPGAETIYLDSTGTTLEIEDHDLFMFLLKVRDESHRFAIGSHRKKRSGTIRSKLEDIPGVGPKRRLELLRYFGGAREVANASKEQLSKVPGISRVVAQIIYESLHGG